MFADVCLVCRQDVLLYIPCFHGVVALGEMEYGFRHSAHEVILPEVFSKLGRKTVDERLVSTFEQLQERFLVVGKQKLLVSHRVEMQDIDLADRERLALHIHYAKQATCHNKMKLRLVLEKVFQRGQHGRYFLYLVRNTRVLPGMMACLEKADKPMRILSTLASPWKSRKIISFL